MKRVILFIMGLVLVSQSTKATDVSIVKNINATIGLPFSFTPLTDSGMNYYYYSSSEDYVLSDETAFIVNSESFEVNNNYWVQQSQYSHAIYYKYTLTPRKTGIYSFNQDLLNRIPQEYYLGTITTTYKVTYNITVVDVTDIIIESDVEVPVGGTYTFKPQLVPNTATTTYTWSSINPQVATISNDGVVSANAIGNTTITCMAHNGITVQCNLHVVPIKVESITLNETEATLMVGEKLQLKAMIAPENATDKSIIWSSTNEAVAVVSESGLVTAVGSGTCQVKVTANDDSGKTASCLVTVEKNNKLTVTDMTQCSGGRGVLNVLLTDEETIMGFQFDLELSEGVTVAEREGNLLAQLTGNAVNTHSISSSKVGDGLYRFVVTPQSSRAISNADGGGMTITIDVADDVPTGTYTMTIKDIEMTVKKAGNVYEDIHPKNSTATLTITEAMMGDVNGDGRVSVTDVISMNSYILEEEPAQFIRKVADLNGDGKVTITDLVQVIDIILGR